MNFDKNTITFISDELLLTKFKFLGIKTGPINQWTRSVYEKKLIKILEKPNKLFHNQDFDFHKQYNKNLNLSYTSIKKTSYLTNSGGNYYIFN